VTTLIADLARALPSALAAGVLPGYFWACFVRRTDGVAERLAYSAALSMASVPAVAMLLTVIAGTGVTLWVALASIAAVAGSGALACGLRGTAHGTAEPALPGLRAIRDRRALALILLAVGLVLASALGLPTPGWLLLLILAALVIAAVLARPRRESAAPRTGGAPAAPRRPSLNPALRAPALATVMLLTAVRGYLGVIWHDWPYLRGEDQFSHAVMTEQMLAHGSYASYLVYPPGFATLSAVVCRLSGLQPLSLFPVLTPAFLLLTTLAAYALATRLWGWAYGLAAAALSGLVLVGPYASFGGGLYPDMLSAFFLMVMVVAALITLYQSPSARSGLLVAVVGAAVVLYHPVGTLYLLLTLAAVVVTCLPYLLVRGGAEARRLARALALSLSALGVLSVGYAWHIYGLGEILGQGGVTRTAVSIDVGTQPVLPAGDLLAWVGSPIVWLGVLGFAALALTVRYLERPGQVLSALTVLLWCLIMYVGSRSTLDGFPQRFERDVGAPLSILAALGLGLIVQSVAAFRRARPVRPPCRAVARPARRAAVWLAPAAAAVVATSAGVQAAANMITDSRPSREVLTPQVAAAGAWLRQHNSGGTVISTPDLNRGITNRAVLAMGGYTGLQSYELFRIRHPRSLPTAGLGPLLDSREVLLHPATCQSASVIAAEDVRYIFLYRIGNEANYAGFRADQAGYRRVFENLSVVIYAPRQTAASSCAGSAKTDPGSTP
jgi:hypothetical protein